ncbi:hypothetical protein BBJ28_00015178 [Nothophytophthora sp. Chile5]|nr:hypothetical protein BBJ28_00015178 [Nothophytophthora sp. Chile5]
MACTICPEAEHKMRYRLLVCSSEACSEASELKCVWRGKMVTSLESQHASVFEYGEHHTMASTPARKKLTTTQKAFCRELAENHLRPMRIRHAQARKFSTPLEELLTLKTVQNFVNHHGRTQMQNHDRVDELRTWIRERAYNGSELTNQAFTFAWEMDNTGKPIVGNGSVEKPFLVGLSTKALMLRIMVPPDSFIIHLDATYKMSQCDYPVLVVGLSDRSRKFHLAAIFIISQETQPVLQAALLSLRRLYYWITQKHLIVRFDMADGDKAQCNALAVVFGDNPAYCFLMRFFHVMKKVQEHIKALSSVAQASILRDIYDLHFARTHSAFLQMRGAFVRRWVQDPEVVPFARYMCAQWLTGPFTSWQAYHTSTGFATTNNPCETFNALLKRDYTLRRRLKGGFSAARTMVLATRTSPSACVRSSSSFFRRQRSLGGCPSCCERSCWDSLKANMDGSIAGSQTIV